MVSSLQGWRQLKLEEVAEIVGGGTPSRHNQAYWEGDIPWLTPSDVTSSRTHEVSLTKEYITDEGLKGSAAKLLPVGTVMMTSRATIGECAINTIPMATNQGFSNFICNINSYNKFLYYILKLHRPSFEKLGTGSTFKEISKKSLKAYEILMPPLSEQHKIADILTSVDNAISKTEAIIEQMEKVKKGLMQQLFTKGTGHSMFKQTEIGEIPESWELKPLEEVCSKIFVGIATSTTSSYTENGVPLIRNQNIREDSLVSEDLLHITHEFSEQNKSKKLINGDVITVRTGYPGVSCVVTKEFEGCHTFTTLISRPYPEVMNSSFLSRYINSETGKRFVQGGKAGGAQQNLNVSIMKRLPVPIPSLGEQEQIVTVLNSIDSKITIEKQKVIHLQNMKKGLMQDLLTGKIRVKVDEQEVVTT